VGIGGRRARSALPVSVGSSGAGIEDARVITVLAGGGGGPKYVRGLIEVVPPEDVTAIVNTGDDVQLHGLRISPDLDSCTYVLSDSVNPATGWGLVDETWSAMDALKRFAPVTPAGSSAGITWFGLGDRDLATHLYRTARLNEGADLTVVTEEIARAFGIRARLLPMTTDRVATMVTVPGEGEIGFQDYFVGRHHDVPVTAIRLEGIERARPGPGVLAALDGAERVVIGPSNPFVSIGPILAVAGVRARLAARRADVVAISPIVAGGALKGPAARMMSELGHEPSVVGIARIYAELASTLVIDEADARAADAIEAAGMRCVVAPTIMHSPVEAAALAEVTLR
jgi:LPPG:FO 2-phospho-L-lactate transferase